MNEAFETLSDVFEELRSESEDREFLELYGCGGSRPLQGGIEGILSGICG